MNKKIFWYTVFMRVAALMVYITVFTTAAYSSTTGNVVIKAMEEEMARSVKDLKLDVFGPPYFVSYQVKDNFMIEIGGDFGAIYKDNTNRYRTLFVEVRVGDYTSDNSGPRMTGRFRHVRLPIEDDEDALRRNLWLATDERYKNAVSTYLRKKGKDVQKMDIEKLDDFSKGEKNISIEPVESRFDLDREKWKKVIKKVSGYFKEYEGAILSSDTKISAKKTIRYYVNSEGTKIIDQSTLINIKVSAWAQADDGMWLSDTEVLHSIKAEDLPSEEEIRKKVAKVANTLIDLKKSALIDPYIGPAIFESDAAGVLFHEAVGHRLEGERQRNEQEGGTFKNKIGEGIMPEFVTLYDDPTLKEFTGIPLFGYYAFDDEGQKAERATLVEDGILRNFLLSRSPIKGFNRSNGHGRSDGYRDPIGRMANLVMKSKKEVSWSTLKEMLLEEAKKQKKRIWPYN